MITFLERYAGRMPAIVQTEAFVVKPEPTESEVERAAIKPHNVALASSVVSTDRIGWALYKNSYFVFVRDV